MTHLAVVNTVYPEGMAKVLISIPDELLRRLDEHATRAEESRSGFLQRIVAEAADGADGQLSEQLGEMLDEITTYEPGPSVVQLIREDRESH
jgi:hypothetical protein